MIFFLKSESTDEFPSSAGEQNSLITLNEKVLDGNHNWFINIYCNNEQQSKFNRIYRLIDDDIKVYNFNFVILGDFG